MRIIQYRDGVAISDTDDFAKQGVSMDMLRQQHIAPKMKDLNVMGMGCPAPPPDNIKPGKSRPGCWSGFWSWPSCTPPASPA
jgi:hypothetical protein